MNKSDKVAAAENSRVRNLIRRLLAGGITPSEIRRHLRLAAHDSDYCAAADGPHVLDEDEPPIVDLGGQGPLEKLCRCIVCGRLVWRD